MKFIDLPATNILKKFKEYITPKAVIKQIRDCQFIKHSMHTKEFRSTLSPWESLMGHTKRVISL